MAVSNKPGAILAGTPDTIIRVSCRPGWQQRCMLQLGDAELEARMHEMAALALRQFDSVAEVIVSATRGPQRRVYTLERYRGSWWGEAA